MKKFTHTDSEGRAKMVDVSGKKMQLRIAKARGKIYLSQETVELVRKNEIKKGDVLTVSEIAGIQSAKRTPELIPLCHPLQISKISVRATIESDGVVAESEVKCIGQTGVEMEALTAVSVALLTVYDMCKAVDKNIRIGDIYLIEKTKQDT